jgi:hypothetical protein
MRLATSAIGHRTDMPPWSPYVRCWGQSGKHVLAASISEFDPDVWSGRALQEDFVELAAAVLHQCIRLLIGALCSEPSWKSARVRSH